MIVILAAGAFLLRRNAASPYHDESDTGGSALGDTTEHSEHSSATSSTGASRRG